MLSITPSHRPDPESRLALAPQENQETASHSLWYKANFQYLLVAVERVGEALKHSQEQISPAERENTLSVSPSVPFPLEQLCTTFRLSPFERDILLLCVGMELDPDFELICAEAQSNSERAYPTLGLALRALPAPHTSVFKSDSPLRYWQLIELGEGKALTSCPIRLDNSILCYLLGDSYQDEKLASLVKTIQVEDAKNSTTLPGSHQDLAQQLVAVWSGAGNSAPIVQLCGSEVEAKRAIATVACLNAGCNLGIVEVLALPTEHNSLYQLLQRWERQALLTNSVLLLECDEVSAADTVRAHVIAQVIRSINSRLIISTQERIRPQSRPVITLDIPQLTYNEQLAIWQSHLGPVAAKLNGQVETLASQFNLNTTAIAAACLTVNHQEISNSIDSSEEVRSDQLWDACRTMARPRLDDLVQRIDSSATWDDLVLPAQHKNTLRELVAHVRYRAQVYLEWGFAGQGSRGLGTSALFAGASGTGKTMAAEVIAKELRLDLYRIDLSTVVSKYIGETEKNLRRIFDAAEAGGAILLFDEADALFGKRSEVKDSHDRHANIEVSYLLQRMEAYQGLAVLTTNLKSSLDPAFLRRLRFVVSFPFPNAQWRTEIWRRIFPKQTPTQGLEFVTAQ